MALEFIVPSALPEATTIPDGAAIPMDTGLGEVQKATPAQIVATGRPLASEAQARAGTSPTTAITPLTLRQGVQTYLAAEYGINEATAAEIVASVTRAQEWAENPVDDPVETGKYSARHHATKAGGHEAGAMLAAGAAALFDGPTIRGAVEDDTALTYTADQPGTVAEGDFVLTPDGWMTVAASGAASSDRTTAGAIKLNYLPKGTIYASMLGWQAGGASNSDAVMQKIEAFMRARGGGHIVFDGDGEGLYTYPIIVPSNCFYDFVSTPTYSKTTYGNIALYLGQMNRTDIARHVGAEEAAYDAGTLAPGDTLITVGGRWNNTAEDFSNSATWVPAVGDRVIVNVNNDTASEPTRPVPSATYLRRIVSVSGSIVRLDAPVTVGGDYVITPASRGLGYDRSTYGGVGRVEVTERSKVRGKIKAVGGVPLFFGGVIEPNVNVEIEGRTGLYGNAARRGYMRVSGEFTETACEIKIGSEYPTVALDLRHKEDGETYTAALVSTGEKSLGALFQECAVYAPEWDGYTLLSIRSPNVKLRNTDILCGATSTLAVVGSSASDGSGFTADDNVRLESNAALMTGLLLDVDPAASNVKLRDMTLVGQVNAGTGVRFEGNGIIERLVVEDNNKIVNLSGNVLEVGDGVTAGGTISRAAGSVALRARSLTAASIISAVPSVSYAASYTPVGSFNMSLTGDLDLQSPAIADFAEGQMLEFVFFASGGTRTITFASGHVFRGVAAPGAGATGSRFTMTVKRMSSVWVCTASNGGWA